MAGHKEPDMEGAQGSGDDMNIPLSDAPLLDLLDALVEQRGKVAAAEALGVNYRTMVTCYESRHVSRRMRKALAEFRDKHGDGGDEQDDEAGDVAEKVAGLEDRVAALEEAHGALAETVETQAKHLAELERDVGGRGDGERQETEDDVSEEEDDDDRQDTQWQPPRRGHGLPDAGVVPLVAEWRGLRTGAEASGSRVNRAKAAVRRWELEIAMLRDFGLTLPPETEPLDASRREDHLRWRKEALASARRDMARAKLLRWLRRALTLGGWWR